jgi:hypothetical protein
VPAAELAKLKHYRIKADPETIRKSLVGNRRRDREIHQLIQDFEPKRDLLRLPRAAMFASCLGSKQSCSARPSNSDINLSRLNPDSYTKETKPPGVKFLKSVIEHPATLKNCHRLDNILPPPSPPQQPSVDPM